MYRVSSDGPGGTVISLHETASDTMLAIYDLRDARTNEFTITDAAGSEMTETQLAMLVLVERMQPGRS
ncbi:hypothetical protein MPPM_3880 [Methylorubrum populi]|uniref:Uncharacterized protein n=1 Tax=Methylorubrum populi TaxID=223967 RepID=A0A160PI41_9HYPH|nr:hypothetical protein MPPM_3880 [Methylorubrum populi]